ncbi:c-type cytochrome [Microvirga thermotolerans]|uniref:Cytochrome C n=1 Tax=Microvirga thermotolerans TaxID=2651334 RepID=A0A5P9K1E2_9HYPH|nr:c-type cytochrome [Microvirga thermotolerans]QFU17500.1 cytochrome C [Microvirga thermotolerans]
MRALRTRTLSIVICTGMFLAACEREKRDFRPDPVTEESQEKTALVSISPGASPPRQEVSGKARAFEGNAYHLNQGKRLYAWFNCNGCHANGGGSSGPPLMDDRWIYGSSLENIVQTIREGRPNGMPSFRGKIPDDQIWELAVYVRSMSGLEPKAAAPGRNDDMHPHPSENRMPPSPPVQGGSPSPSALAPQ